MAGAVAYAVGSAVLGATGSFAVASTFATLAYGATIAATIAAPFVISNVVSQRARRAGQISGFAGGGIVNDDRGLQTSIPKPAPEHALLLGYATLAGTPFFVRGGEDNRPYLYKGMLLAAHECDGLDSVLINGTRVLINPDDYQATSVPFFDGSTAFILVSFRNGDIDQAIDPILDEDFTLPSTYRQRGQATAVIKAHYGTGNNRDKQDDKHRELYGDGEFEPLFRVRGAKVFDPRNATHVLAQPSTYEWTRNAALNTAHFLRWKYPDIAGRLDWDRIARAADICDEYRYALDGTAFRQFTVDGVIRANDPVPETIEQLLSACGGRLIRRAGSYHIYPGQAETAVGTVHRGNLRGSLQYRNGLPRGQLTNKLIPEFFSPERDYSTVPGPVISDAADVVADGETRERTERYSFTERHYRAQRLAQRDYREGRLQESVLCGVDISALQWDAGRTVNLDLAAFNPALTGQWRIERKAWSDGLSGYTLELKRYSPAVNGFDAASDEQPFEVSET